MTTDTSRIDTSADALLKLAEECECHDACMDTTAETLRALAAEKRAAEDGVTPEVVKSALEAADDVTARFAGMLMPMEDRRLCAMEAALKSAALALQSKDALDAERWRTFKEIATAWHKEPLVNAKTGEEIAGIVRWTIWIHEAKNCSNVWQAIDAAMEASHEQQ